MPKGRVLVIAGSDNLKKSLGGFVTVFGIEADQKVIAAHGCYAMTAITALTAQNTLGVVDIHQIPPAFVRKSVDVCISDIGVDVVKTGMLTSAQTIKEVAKALRDHNVNTVVVDPVMVSTSGSQLLPPDAIQEIRAHLMPLTTVLTPNVPEAQLILSHAGILCHDAKVVDDLIEMAKNIQALGPKYVLLKGGHLPFRKDGTVGQSEDDKEVVVNILYGDGMITKIQSDYQKSRNTHGTGCSLASAIASNLANGLSTVEAVKNACRYVEAGIRTATDLGHGNGPINHFHSTYTLPFSPGHFIEYVLERADVQKPWREHTEHEFVAGLGDGSLPIASFRKYLIQDYLFLVQFARAHALLAYKANNMEDVVAEANILTHINHEMKLHIEYCEGFGLTKEDIICTPESQACTAYTRYVLDIGQSQDWFALQVALAPCLIGYGEIAARLHADVNTKREGNVYWKWIENYVAEDYKAAVKTGSALLERHAVFQSPHRIEELVLIFIHATKMETGFWDMGYKD